MNRARKITPASDYALAGALAGKALLLGPAGGIGGASRAEAQVEARAATASRRDRDDKNLTVKR